MSNIFTTRNQVSVTSSEKNRSFTVALKNFPKIPDFILSSPGPDPEQDKMIVANENALRALVQSAFSGGYIINVKQINDEGIGVGSFPFVYEYETINGTEYENFNLIITIQTVGNSITDWSVVLAGTSFRGTPPTQTVMAVDSTVFIS